MQHLQENNGFFLRNSLNLLLLNACAYSLDNSVDRRFKIATQIEVFLIFKCQHSFEL